MAMFRVLHPEHPFIVEADEFKYHADAGVFVLLKGEEKVAVVPSTVTFHVVSADG
jgi:hypothetical protein